MSVPDPSLKGIKIDPRWRWHYQALMRLNGRLLRESERRRREAGASPGDTPKDAADLATEETERGILYAELGMEENAIAEVEAALARIRSGTYGVCETTGRPISADRLRAIPWTRYCREAAPRGRSRA